MIKNDNTTKVSNTAVIRASHVALLSCPTICSLLLLLLYTLGK